MALVLLSHLATLVLVKDNSKFLLVLRTAGECLISHWDHGNQGGRRELTFINEHLIIGLGPVSDNRDIFSFCILNSPKGVCIIVFILHEGKSVIER